ncbi:hypothetical protein ESB00_10550 [Oleiharenicola lentus]|uniref:Uncharacterized protein n=1 Tax=Oleiharenicola lentus TaxID=2508720 RepID=A0A4Q1CB12_9BACT|nr:hypothetical protein [Oleiharenicola lentus]RXK56287.1 hypothetical protein ESB00_10550 [Oleiharenicola lentus]
MSGGSPVRVLGRDTLALLALRLSAVRLDGLNRGHFYVGLVGTWVAGIGRYWDNPKAELAQKLGFGSLAYIFVLSALLWCVFRPVAGRAANYWKLVSFVGLTSFPAWLYAIPVERFMSLDAAIALNVLFLAVVAAWRLALLFRYTRLVYRFGWWRTTVCCLLPMTAIICLLAALNLERAVFEIMGGLREPTSADGAYFVILLLSLLSVCLFPVLLLNWLWFLLQRLRAGRVGRQGSG